MESNKRLEDKTMFDEMKGVGSNLPNIVEFLIENGWKTKNHHDNWVNKNHIGEHSTHEAFKLEKEWQETPLQKAVEVLCNALREDKEYYNKVVKSLSLNTKTIIDNVKSVEYMPVEDLNNYIENHYENFLNLLINK